MLFALFAGNEDTITRRKPSLVLIFEGLIWSYASNLQDLMGAVADSYHSFNNRNSRVLVFFDQIHCQCIVGQCCSFWFVLLNLVGDLGWPILSVHNENHATSCHTHTCHHTCAMTHVCIAHAGKLVTPKYLWCAIK